MPDLNEREKQRLIVISEICENFSEERFHELAGLAFHFSYMELERKSLEAAFERFQKLKRANDKQRAWERVADQVFRLKTIAVSAIACNSKKD